MSVSSRIKELILESIESKQVLVSRCIGEIESGYMILSETLKRGNKILTFGNGGSAADAQHFASEIVGRCVSETPAQPAIALTSDSTILTATANDYGFDQVFARQIQAHGRKGDLAIGITTSGNSPNILEAFKIAKSMNLKTIALLGRDGGKARDLVDLAIVVPSESTPRIQEMHITIIHTWCQMMEEGQ